MLNGNVTVTYHGELLFNTQVSDNVGTNYWIPDDPYISSTVHNAPSTAEILIQQGGPGVITNTLTFSAPVLNPVLALVSLGRTNLPVEYSFDGDVTILSSGQGFWGGDPNGSLFEDPGNVIRGHEGHGTIQFNGTFSSISWVSSPSEFWHGFQVGAIPEPETYAMLLAGLGLLGFAARRRRSLMRAAI